MRSSIRHVAPAPILNVKQLAEEIDSVSIELERHQRSSLKTQKRLGMLLAQAKQTVGHGKFLLWLEENFRWSRRTAARLIRLYEHWAEHSSKEPDELTYEEAVEVGEKAQMGHDVSFENEVNGEADKTSEKRPKEEVGQVVIEPEGSTEESPEEDEAPPTPTIPERLQQFFASVPLLRKAVSLAKLAGMAFQEVESTPTYLKEVEGKRHEEYSTNFRSAALAIKAMIPKCPCPECGGVHEPSMENDPCKTCLDKGYLTIGDEEE